MNLAARVLRRAGWAVRRPATTLARRRATRQLRDRLAAASAAPPSPGRAGEELDVLLSHRITGADRLAMLEAIVGQLAASVGTAVPVRVDDASDEPWASEVDEVWAAAGLDVALTRSGRTQPRSLLGLLEAGERRYACLQFDDMLTVGLSPALLDAACGLLATGVVPVVCPSWPLTVSLDEGRRTIRLEAYEERAGRFRFWQGRRRRALAVVEVGGVAFGIFENFTYGFFLNHLVAPRADLARRLAWYVEHVSERSAHQIELAGAGGVGPVWHHVAVPLAGVALLDLDFAHTAAAVRNEHPGNRALLDAVTGGWDVEVVVRRS